MQHKWHKEIKAWADGAEIEVCINDGHLMRFWTNIPNPDWSDAHLEYRIKPQPKEPQYLYVYADEGGINLSQYMTMFNNSTPYIGKIKLEQDD